MFSQPDIFSEINQICQKSGHPYNQYSCKHVSWDDSSRHQTGSFLSCFGTNITDTYLTAKNGTKLMTVRTNNWNEKLGIVNANSIALVEGNQKPDGLGRILNNITLETFLKNCKFYGGYAGLKEENCLDSDLYKENLDKKVSIRFQTTFLPLGNDDNIQFCTEAYNYQTKQDNNPKNLILLCTSQGLALQSDSKGKQKLFHHNVTRDNQIDRHWLEAEESRFKVGQNQDGETELEKRQAISRGKAVSSFIGLKSMGKRFNVLMTIQIPLVQQREFHVPYNFIRLLPNKLPTPGNKPIVHYDQINFNPNPQNPNQNIKCYQTKEPVPKFIKRYYFEVQILKNSSLEDSNKVAPMGIGLVNENYPKTEYEVGWAGYSFGFHADDGCKFAGYNKGQGVPYSEPYKVGDVIGCLYDQEKCEISFTKNGKLLGVAFSNVDVNMDLYPAVSIQNYKTEVFVKLATEFDDCVFKTSPLNVPMENPRDFMYKAIMKEDYLAEIKKLAGKSRLQPKGLFHFGVAPAPPSTGWL